MIRVIGFFVGLVFAGILLISMIVGLVGYFNNPPEELAAEQLHLEAEPLSLPSDGFFGKYDKRQLQRGFQVYT